MRVDQQAPDKLDVQIREIRWLRLLSLSCHCSTFEVVGWLTMRCREPGEGVVVAIVASRAPGR